MSVQQQAGYSPEKKSNVTLLAEKITPQLMRASAQARNLNIAPPPQVETADKLRRRYIQIHGLEKYAVDVLGSSNANARFHECLVKLPDGDEMVVAGDGVERVTDFLQRLSGGNPDRLPYEIKINTRRRDGEFEWTQRLSM